MSDTVTVAMIKSQPGKRDEIKRIFNNLAGQYIEEKSGFKSFFYCYDDNDPDGLIIVILGNEAAGSDFKSQPWFSEFQKTTHDLLAGSSDIRQATPFFVKGHQQS